MTDGGCRDRLKSKVRGPGSLVKTMRKSSDQRWPHTDSTGPWCAHDEAGMYKHYCPRPQIGLLHFLPVLPARADIQVLKDAAALGAGEVRSSREGTRLKGGLKTRKVTAGGDFCSQGGSQQRGSEVEVVGVEAEWATVC